MPAATLARQITIVTIATAAAVAAASMATAPTPAVAGTDVYKVARKAVAVPTNVVKDVCTRSPLVMLPQRLADPILLKANTCRETADDVGESAEAAVGLLK
ncbi:hypothetical protein SMC26_23230 [Actinomadura fulvescens]|uniref:Uncharacterized protein n=1 Tax=Actinomadura fulvescens TaxID=46160 RepID=A0ABN3QXI6_9ACTN